MSKIKILALHPQPYLLAFGGLCVASRAMFEGMITQGFDIRVLTTTTEAARVEASLVVETPRERHLRRSDVDVYEQTQGEDCYSPTFVERHLQDFVPDFVVVAEDVVSAAAPGRTPQIGLWLEFAREKVPAKKIVYCCHAAAALPFGPHSLEGAGDRSGRLALFQGIGGIITVSQHLKRYIGTFVASPEATVIPFPVYGTAPFANVANFDARTVGLINPSKIKGASVFLEVARALPHIRFLAVPTWAEDAETMRSFREVPNIEVIRPIHDRDELYGQFSCLLTPSLWQEAWGLVAVESMLRGVPVIAADIGGLREAKLGVDYLLPVNPIEEFDAFEVAVLPRQDIEPWVRTVERLLSDRDEFDRVSKEGRDASRAFVEGLKPTAFASYFRALAASAS